MSRGHHAQTITGPDIETLAKIRIWAAKQEGMNPAVDVVLDDLIERLTEHKRLGALIRIRIKNKGRSPAEKASIAEQERRNIAARQRIRQNDPETRTVPGELWSAEERIRLKQLFDDGLSDADIGERLGRSEKAVIRKRSNMGLLRPYNGSGFSQEDRERGWKAASVAALRQAPRTPLQKARAIAARRRQEEAQGRKEGEAA